MRSSNLILTAANVAKMYVGIAFITTSKSISQAGLYGSMLGFSYVLLMNIYCVYLLLKARNRFKKERIVDICDLSSKLYGSWTRPYMSSVLLVTNALYLICYVVFFGSQLDQLMCKTFKVAECE
mmetsp:Transcript_17683/g.29890  ORF Transcript_17683/g.29890 Transcript_17683/m.29890 type:complete len:124 (+) Transcript_17683:321-692(+)